MSNLLYPILRILFPDLKKGSKALDAICLNISANILGLGNAATPLGIAAMKELDKNNNRKSIASNSMVTFVILNTSSLQLIPTMMSILRKEHITAIIVTHDISEAISMSDRVLVLSERPGTVKGIHNIDFKIDGRNPINCRESPKFSTYFNTLWKELKVVNE